MSIPNHFGSQSTFLYGRFINNSFHTVYNSLPITSPVNAPFSYPIKNNALFYKATVFNSFLKSKEELFTVLSSEDDKLTITKDNIEDNTLYTFITTEENRNVRIAKLYKFDSKEHVGFKVKGRARKHKSTFKFSLNGNLHDLIPLKEYEDGEEIEAVLVKVDNDLRVYRPTTCITDFFDATVFKEHTNYFLCKNAFLHGIIFKNELEREVKLGDVLKVRILKENGFKFVLTMREGSFLKALSTNTTNTTGLSLYDLNKNKKSLTYTNNFDNENVFDLKEGFVEKAHIRNIHPVHGTFVTVRGFIGVMKKRETSLDYIPDINKYLCGKEELTGIVYNINKEEKSFLFSVRKYEEEIKEDQIDGENKQSTEDIKIDKNKIEEYYNEDNNKRVKNDLLTVSDLKENKEVQVQYNEVKSILEKYNIHELINKPFKMILPLIKDDIDNFRNKLQVLVSRDSSLTSLYVHLLAYQKDNIYENIKKLLKTEQHFTELVKKALGCLILSDKTLIFKLYFTKYPSQDTFKMYYTHCLKNNLMDKDLLANDEFHVSAIDCLYKNDSKEARTRIEQFISNETESKKNKGSLNKKNNAWKAYIVHEINNVDYCRNLFRRVTRLKWSIEEAKGWFKLWYEFERDNKGNLEEVTENAKKYVEGLQK